MAENLNFPGGTVGMRCVDEAFVAASAVVVGDVRLGAETSVWPFACIRGDVAAIRVGARCSIQDQAMLHTRGGEDLEIGDDVVMGHQVCVHCRIVGDGCLIGIGATVLDGAVLGEGCLVAAGAVVRPGERVAPGMMVAGVPARVMRPVSDAERAYITRVVAAYRRLARQHAGGVFDGPPPAGSRRTE
ncbi:MAG: gamma carbonic anhydrase family protein [Spirochaetaceae bacterium]|nr:gamma carbonic anhydrase family protein [Spirochaetaceae bacterium]